MKKLLLSIFLGAFMLSTNALKAQIIPAGLSIEDSLSGFNEAKFITSQDSLGISGNKLKKALSIAKKEFIYEKYFHHHKTHIYPQRLKNRYLVLKHFPIIFQN